ncbi:MAG: HEAT repeat domain-containing protein [Candidatus Krumholzibacteriia bacterium]
MIRKLMLLTLLLALAGCRQADQSTADGPDLLAQTRQANLTRNTDHLADPSASNRCCGLRWFATTIPADPAVHDRIVELLRHDPDVDVRRVAAVTLGSPGYEHARRDLQDAVRDDEDLHVRLNAARSLGRHRNPDDVWFWQRLLDNDRCGEQMHRVAIEALAVLNTGESGRVVCDVLRRRSRLDGPCLDALASMDCDSALAEFLRVMDRHGYSVSTTNAMRLREKHGDATMRKLVEVYRRCDASRANGLVISGDAFVDW